MCDFHSIAIRADGAIAHIPENSHSGAVKAAGWAENSPHKRPVFIEAEWNGRGEYPGADKICRVPDGEKLTAKQREVCDRHYKHLAAIMCGKPTKAAVVYFDRPEYSDVALERIKAALPAETGYLFARLNSEVGGEFSARVSAEFKVGADLSLLWPKFSLWLLTDAKAGVIRFAKKSATRAAIEGVSALYARWIDTGKKPEREEWIKARNAAAPAYADAYAYAAYAYAYAAYAAYAAAYAAYAYAADAYAYAYAAYAAAAADAAYAYAAYAADARKAHWALMAEKFVELLKSS
jgi:hypothetical protein